MAYKVLGQVSTTAPSTAATLVNLVKDSSFAAYNFSSNITASSNNSTQNIPNSPWRWAPNSSTSPQLTNPVIQGYTAAFGSGYSALGLTGMGWMTQGLPAAQNPSTTPSGASQLDLATAISVSASTTYYHGVSYRNSSAQTISTISINWFTSNGSYISTNSIGGGTYSTANTWARFTTNVTSPSTAAYATIYYYVSGGTWVIDGVVFGTDSAYASTFVEPVLPSVAVTTSPYNKKTDGYLTETYFANSGTTYAGDLVTLYTVPAGKSTVASTLTITNLNPSSATTYRVAVIPSGQTLDKKHFLFLDTPIAAASTQTITIGMTLAEGDVVKIAADTSTVSATLFGSES